MKTFIAALVLMMAVGPALAQEQAPRMGGVLKIAVIGEPPPGIEQPEGMYWIDGTKDLVYGLPELVRHPGGLPAFVRPYWEPHVFAVLAWDDARPFAVRYRALVRRGYVRAARKVRKRLRRKRSTHPA